MNKKELVEYGKEVFNVSCDDKIKTVCDLLPLMMGFGFELDNIKVMRLEKLSCAMARYIDRCEQENKQFKLCDQTPKRYSKHKVSVRFDIEEPTYKYLIFASSSYVNTFRKRFSGY